MQPNLRMDYKEKENGYAGGDNGSVHSGDVMGAAVASGDGGN